MARGGLGRLARSLDNHVSRALYAAGQLVEDEAKGSITRGSAGGQKGGKHQHVPSLPGQPPNEEFGGLRGNIETIQEEPFKVIVSSNAEYSQHLEFGTSKMAARPFMGPAINQPRDEVSKLIAAGVKRAAQDAKE
ncbi:HK97-gp10 family putative phage morphogenesis protein [Sphingomonas kyungheensis]|uniref:HK97-gp10 family putative phage morphogenesis protein n=1 Tax=Sphingomonas kyungheensis TaxID=1069987 RepID=A0ABU8H448_9SPHN